MTCSGLFSVAALQESNFFQALSIGLACKEKTISVGIIETVSEYIWYQTIDIYDMTYYRVRPTYNKMLSTLPLS